MSNGVSDYDDIPVEATGVEWADDDPGVDLDGLLDEDDDAES
jgi:hypothetical protein